MTTAKMTNKTALNAALSYIPESETAVREKLVKMIEQLDKKNASPRKQTAQQAKNEDFKASIVDFLADNADTGYTVSDLLKAVPALEGDSNQHVSALMRALVLSGTVEKYTDKRRTYFKFSADAEVEGE